MKIGILTFHRAHNYGAILQCYALQQTFLKLGSQNVEVIDYRQPYIEQNYAVFSLRQALRKLRSPLNFIGYLKDTSNRRIRKWNFESFVKKHLVLSCPCTSKNIPQDCDLYVIGSDQLWSTNVMRGVDSVYLGKFPIPTKACRYTYAISSNNKSLDRIGDVLLKQYSQNFRMLSFREKSIVDKVSSMTGMNCRQDIDPVLLTTQEDWDEIIYERWASRKYILIYQIGSPNGDPSLIPQKANEFAKEVGLEVIDVTSKLVSPEDFVSLFKYAQLILTTSFHGTAFSVLFNRPFYTVSVDEKLDARSLNLLNTLNIPNRYKKIEESFNEGEIDYSVVNSLLDKFKMNSVRYLKSIFNETVSSSK